MIFSAMLSTAIDGHSQKVSRAANARIVIANQVFALAGGSCVVEARDCRNEPSQVFFDLPLILRGGRHDPRFGYQTVVADTVAMVEQSARCLGRMGSLARTRRESDTTFGRRRA